MRDSWGPFAAFAGLLVIVINSFAGNWTTFTNIGFALILMGLVLTLDGLRRRP